METRPRVHFAEEEPVAKQARRSGRQEQTVEFERGQPLGLAVDEELRIQRVNDRNSPLIRAATYGLVHWRIAAVDGVAVASKEALAAAVRTPATGVGRLLLEADESAPVSATELSASKPREVVAPPMVATLLSSPSSSAAAAEGESAREVSARETASPSGRGGPPTTTTTTTTTTAAPTPAETAEAQRVLQLGAILPTFRLGRDSVSRLITGSCTWQLSEDDAARADVAVQACAAYTMLGCRTFDCGDIYAGVEALVGKFVATARGHSRPLADAVRIHTKVIPDLLPQAEAPEVVELGELNRALHGRILASVLRSANRLGVSKLDLVNLHWWDWHIPGFEVALEVLNTLREKGTVKAVGVTNVDLDHLERIVRDHQGKRPPGVVGDSGNPEETASQRLPIACVQVNLSLIDRRPLTSGLSDLCLREGVALLAHGALCGGLLSEPWIGRAKPNLADLRPGVALNLVLIDHFGGWDAFQDLLATLAAVAAKHSAGKHDAPDDDDDDGAASEAVSGRPRLVTLSMVAVAWTLAQEGVEAVVLGARGARHVDDAAYAVASLKLDQADMDLIDSKVRDRGPHGPVYGIERLDPRLRALAGSGADGSLQRPVDRRASRAGTTAQIDECAARLGDLHAAYRDAMPALPDDVADYIAGAMSRNSTTGAAAAPDASDASDASPAAWMATSAYDHLNTVELVDLLRGFVAELDCLPASADDGISRKLRAFAATMLASSEQARFVEQRRKGTSTGAAGVASHRATSDAAADAARNALRHKILAACLKSGDAGSATNLDAASLAQAGAAADGTCAVQ